MVEHELILNAKGARNLFAFKTLYRVYRKGYSTGGGFFHSKGTRGGAAHKGILFWTSSLAKGILFGNFSRV